MQKSLLTSIFFIVIFTYIISHLHTAGFFNAKMSWDEVDYINAANLGPKENLLENNSIDLFSFIKIGLNKINNDTETINSLALSLPKEDNDPFRLRHFHSPLPVIFWHLFESDNFINKNLNLKISNLILILIFFLMLIVFLTKFLSLNFHQYYLSLILLSVFFTSNYFIYCFSTLNFHNFLSIVNIFFLINFIRFIHQPNKIKIFFISCSIGLSIMTLETSLFIFFLLPILIFVSKLKNLFNLKNIVLILIFLTLFLLLTWPGFFLKGTFIKTGLMYIYKIYFVNNVEYSNHPSFLINWYPIIFKNIILFSCLIIIFVFAFFNRKNISYYKFIPLYLGLFYIFAITPFMVYKTYAFPGITMILFSGLLVLNDLKINLSKYKIKIILPTLFLLFFSYKFLIILNQFDYEDQTVKKNDIIDTFILLLNDKNFSNDEKVLIDGGHVFKYYSNYQSIDNFYIRFLNKPGFFIRENYNYIDVYDRIKNNYYKIIIFRKHFNFPQNIIEEIKNSGYNKSEVDDYFIFNLK